MSRKNKAVGYSKKYASTMKSFDRSASRLTRSLSRSAFSYKKRHQGKSETTSVIGNNSSNWENASLTTKQLIVSCIVGMLLPAMSFAGMDKTAEITGTLLLVLFFFFAIPFLVMVLIFMVFNTITRPRSKYNAKQNCATEENINEVNEPAQLYLPNPEWMGQTGLVDSRANAKILAPQFLKQAQESARILQTTTDPSTFFTRYDFCVGRLMELEECKKYGAPVSATSDLKKYRSLNFRDDAVKEIIHRTEEKYQAKIESLKTAKAKQNGAEKYHQAFELYLPYMTDGQKSELGEASAYLFDLAQK